MITKTEAKELLKRDFIPKGKPVNIKGLVFRHTDELEVYPCCYRTGNDIQSGPYYCGQISDWITEVEDGGCVSLCEKHGRRLRIKKEQE